MPLPEEIGSFQPAAGSKRDGVMHVIAPGTETAMYQGTELLISQLRGVLREQISAEKIAASASWLTRHPTGKRTNKILDLAQKHSRGAARIASLVGGPASYLAMELAAQYLDTTLAEILGQIGGIHFEAAQEELDDARNASTERGKRMHRERAASLLGAAYKAYEAELTERKRLILPKRERIRSHLGATNSALILAAINRADPDTREATKKWADNAAMHFRDHDVLERMAAENGKALNSLGEDVGTVLFSPLAERAQSRIQYHDDRLARLAERQRQFAELYELLTAGLSQISP
ncbi:hypothetical protein ND748_13425 [Frankia sp. AiPs1]|uniref:hypothetical protein n=1 Tax=Frankia sp. AiPs1 TaxID=573493 RepID=UPI0020448939|nr:hypothetical protein [Frankia sp. AiPs1]MCM3922656.1 hypothetical protein [Frankia sp. AiPs1]